MPARLVLIVVLVAGIVLLLRWFARTPPAQLTRALKRAAIIGAIALVVLLTVTGRMHWLFAALGTWWLWPIVAVLAIPSLAVIAATMRDRPTEQRPSWHVR